MLIHSSSVRGALAVSCLWLASASSSAAQIQLAPLQPAQRELKLDYDVAELPDVGTSFHQVHVFDLNDAGEAVGYMLDSQLRWRAIRWDALGQPHDLGGSSGTWSMARGISESGVIGGFHGSTLQTARPVLWIHGSIIPLPDPAAGTGIEVWDVNDTLEAVGRGFNGTDAFAMRWTASGGSALANPFSYAFAVNENGVTAGFVTVAGFNAAARWNDGVLTVLPDLGEPLAKAIGVNAAGTIVGGAGSPRDGLTHAVRWNSDGIVDLGTFQDTFITTATGINAHNLIVGYYYLDPIAEITRALLWTPQGVARDLNELIRPNSGWTLSTADKVNDAGWIVGVGTRAGLGGTRSFVAKPR